MKKITKIALAVLSGLLISASWPTRGITILAFVAFVPLIFIQDKASDKNDDTKVFPLSLISFLIWNTLTTWWVWNSTAAGAVAMILLNSVFMSTTFWLYHFTRKKIYANQNGYFLLIVFFLAFEYLHHNWQLNWPWLSIGNVFSHNHSWVQWYEFTGIAGGTIWVLAANILAYKLIKEQLSSSKFRHILTNVLLFVAVILVPIIVSKIMYNNYEEKGEEVEVVVVQPNIDPYKEEFALSSSEILERNFSQAEPLMTENTRFVVSPESSIHENIWLENLDYYYSIRNLQMFSKNYNRVAYVIGASTYDMVPEGNEDDFAARKFYDADRYYYAYNTAFLVSDGAETQWHQKSRLTPGVEMMPSWWFLRPIRNLAIDLGGTVGTLKSEDKATVFSQQTTDNGQQSMSTQEYKIAPLICYESVFGGYVTEFVRNGANMIFVITNDGWWGDTPGHRQHFEMSKLRAIENRRSIARSANTGISGFINQRGDVIEQTKYWEADALRNNLIVNDKLTFYSQYGDYLYRIAAFVSAIVFCFSIVISILRKR